MLDIVLAGVSIGEWGILIGGFVALIGLIRGLFEYIKSNRMKRAEFLEALIKEFNDDKMFIAKKLLDDFWIDRASKNPTATDKELIENGSKEKNENLNNDFRDILKDHKGGPVTIEVDHRVRQSFDDLLDFFTKLEYYLNLKLISKDELLYFRYYLARCSFKADGKVLEYADAYGYPSLFRLLYVLNLDHKNKKEEKGLKFINSKQELYYDDLKNDIPQLL